MSTVTPTLNLPQPAPVPSAAKPPAPAAAATSTTPPPAPPSVPSTTVTLSPQAQSALAAAAHPASSAATSTPAPAAHDGSVYESLKNGISSAVSDVGDAIAGGAHAVVDGVEATLSTANQMVKGALGLPFAAVAKVCDAAGAVIDEL